MGEKVFEKYAQGWRSPLESLCIRMPPEAVREALVMTKKGLVWSGKERTSCFRKASFILEKAISWSTDHCHWAFLWVSESRGLARLENPEMNFQ